MCSIPKTGKNLNVRRHLNCCLDARGDGEEGEGEEEGKGEGGEETGEFSEIVHKKFFSVSTSLTFFVQHGKREPSFLI